MSMPKACCTLPPVESNYIPTGSEIPFGDFTVYETGDLKSNRLLICVYDIFGYHPVTKQFCDKLGSAGFRIIMPDFFRGSPWPADQFPPNEFQVLLDWVAKAGSWEKVVKGDFHQLIQHYKGQGVDQFGCFGFCWGAKMCVEASTDFDDIKAAGMIHPSFVEDKDGDRVKSPVLVLPTKDDADMIPFCGKVKARLGEDGVDHYRFEDMAHGFCAARGDMDNELNRKRVDEALAMTGAFFNKNMKK